MEAQRARTSCWLTLGDERAVAMADTHKDTPTAVAVTPSMTAKPMTNLRRLRFRRYGSVVLAVPKDISFILLGSLYHASAAIVN